MIAAHTVRFIGLPASHHDLEHPWLEQSTAVSHRTLSRRDLRTFHDPTQATYEKISVFVVLMRLCPANTGGKVEDWNGKILEEWPERLVRQGIVSIVSGSI